LRPRVLYLGFGAVGVACLSDLLADDFDVVGVLTRANDREVKPGDATSVFTRASEAGLHCFSDTNPSSPDFLAAVEALHPDLLISVQYDRILKLPLLAIPKHGSFNLHFGPLPRLRGCFPTKWAILENEPAGVTFHHIDPGIDSGDVIDQIIVPLTPDETDETLYHRLQKVGHELFRRQLPWLKTLQPPARKPQDPASASYHPKELPFGSVIDWTRDAEWVERFIRAFTFPPYPAAKTTLNGQEIQIAAPVEITGDLGLKPGQSVLQDDGRVAIGCGRGSLLIPAGSIQP
jgi:methionyl-tRNA formyltransferase